MVQIAYIKCVTILLLYNMHILHWTRNQMMLHHSIFSQPRKSKCSQNNCKSQNLILLCQSSLKAPFDPLSIQPDSIPICNIILFLQHSSLTCQVWYYHCLVEDQSLDITPNLPTTPVLVSQLVGGHEALLSDNQWPPPPSSTKHQYATLMSPNQGKTAVCGSSIFVGWLGRRSLVAAQ